MRLRIVRPLPVQLEDVDVSHLRFGAAYDLKSPLYDLLLAAGYAVPEDDPLTLTPTGTKAVTGRQKRAEPRPRSWRQKPRGS